MFTRWSTGPGDPRYGNPYGYRYGRRGRPPRIRSGNSCLRDACLLETGCCIGEAVQDNCMLAGVMLLPHLATSAVSGGRRTPTPTDGTAPAGSRTAAAMQAMIRVYQRDISAHRPACCRFTPSCSAYAVQALQAHGVMRGLVMTARRLLRCRPGGSRGADPVRGTANILAA